MIPMARPRIVVDGGEIFYVFRDEERGSKVSLAHATDVANSKWSISDFDRLHCRCLGTVS